MDIRLDRRLASWLVTACCGLLLAGQAAAGDASVDGIRIWAAPDNTRLVFDISAPVEHSLITLDNPDRIVIDLKSVRLATELTQPRAPDGLLGGLRAAARNGDDLRVVLDLNRATRPKSFLLKPNSTYGHRLVIDLQDRLDTATATPTEAPIAAPEAALRDVVIAIDAGHGGDDPGAIGSRGTQEKEITLAMAQRLARRIDREPGMRTVMIRSGDYFISLRKRIAMAREARADLLISIHADAFTDPGVKGSSVFVISRRGASSEMARLLAKRENASDLVGGVSLDDKDDLLARVLIDLQQSVTYEGSVRLATKTLHELKQVNSLHKHYVEKAGFAVLKAPDIPSILVETAFISNPSEERKLVDARHQERLVGAMHQAIRAYFVESPPPGTLFASRRHTITNGDTLSEIAVRYNVSLDHLRVANNLNDDLVRVGQVLQIP